jgi:hypothetical protein
MSDIRQFSEASIGIYLLCDEIIKLLRKISSEGSSRPIPQASGRASPNSSKDAKALTRSREWYICALTMTWGSGAL